MVLVNVVGSVIVVVIPMVGRLSSVLVVLVVWSVGLDAGGELARFEGIILIVVVVAVVEGRSISVIHFGGVCVAGVCVASTSSDRSDGYQASSSSSSTSSVFCRPV